MLPLVHCSRNNLAAFWCTATLHRFIIFDNSKYPLAHRWPNTRFYGGCRNYADFLYLKAILRRFRIRRCSRQAALHSALFNYTLLVINGDWQKYGANIIKQMQTGINRNKYTFLHYEIIGAPQKCKKPAASLSSVNFCHNLWNLSHETVLYGKTGTLQITFRRSEQ